MSKPKIIVLCGSSRFVDLMAVLAWWLERDEQAIVMGLHLLPGWYPNLDADHMAEAEGVAAQMDALHLSKIDMADEVFVVNWQGYIGNSTRNEIKHAMAHGKPIRWLETAPAEFAHAVGSLASAVAYHDRLDRALDTAKKATTG